MAEKKLEHYAVIKEGLSDVFETRLNEYYMLGYKTVGSMCVSVDSYGRAMQYMIIMEKK